MVEKKVASVDLTKDALYIVKEGYITKVSPKTHGQDIVIWKNGQVLDVDRSERIRLNGQEVI